MASTQQQAITKAQELGVAIEFEAESDAIEVWSHDAHLTDDPAGQSHTYFVQREATPGKKRTNAAMWREALRYMEDDLRPCPDDCECRTATAAAAPEGPAEQDEVPVSGTFPVAWPDSVARLFWRALAKDGAGILASSRGLTRESNQAKGALTITGAPDAALEVALELPLLFTRANESLKEWRKASETYRRFLPLSTPETRRAAFTAEQDFLRDFCRAVAGTHTSEMLAHEGVQAGLAYATEGN